MAGRCARSRARRRPTVTRDALPGRRNSRVDCRGVANMVHGNKLTRRDALGRVVSGVGALSLLKGAALDAQQRPPAATATKGMVNTVLGPIPTTKLGLCLSHEHICTASAGIWQSWPS